MGRNVTDTQKKLIRALKTLEKSWPSDGTMIMANGHFLYLCTKHPQDGGKVLESFRIPSDGGDPDWENDLESRPTPKRLARFKPPSTRYLDTGTEPPPRFTGDKP